MRKEQMGEKETNFERMSFTRRMETEVKAERLLNIASHSLFPIKNCFYSNYKF